MDDLFKGEFRLQNWFLPIFILACNIFNNPRDFEFAVRYRNSQYLQVKFFRAWLLYLNPVNPYKKRQLKFVLAYL